MPLRRPGRTLPFAPLLIGLAITIAACSGEKSTAGAGSSSSRLAEAVYVELVPETEWGQPPASESTAFVPPDRLDEWTVETPDPSKRQLRDVPEFGRALVLIEGGGSAKIKIPHEHVPAEYQRVRIWCQTIGFLRVAVGSKTAEGYWNRTPYREVPIRTLIDPGPVEIDLAPLRDLTDRTDVITIAVDRFTHETAIYKIELLREAPKAVLPDPSEGPAHLAVGDDSRSCYAALPGHPLRGRALLPPGSQGLALEIAPAPVGPASEKRSATVIASRAGEELRRIELASLGQEWTSVRIEQEDLGDELEVRVLTDSEGGVLATVPRAIPPADGGHARGPGVVVWVTSDTQRGDYIGYAGGPRTPFLDGLAAEGTLFMDATSVTSITNPSHTSMFTGLPLRDTAIYGNLAPMSPRALTVAEAFREAGYRTFAAVSAPHLVPHRSGLGQGFERCNGPHGLYPRDGAQTIAAAERMLDAAPGEKVFLWLHLFDVHGPYRPHGKLVKRYYDGDPYDERLPPLPEEMQAKWDRKIRDLKYIRALYQTEVTYVDSLLEGLFERRERLRNGTIAFTADHGESLGDQESYWSHETLYPSTLKVPLFFKGPGIPSGQILSSRVSNLDVARTLLELAEVPDAADFPGRSLLDESVRAELDSEPRFFIGAHALAAAVELDGWFLLLRLKELRWTQPPLAPRHGVELYNARVDPDLENDLTTEEAARAKRMRGALVEWLSQGPLDGGFAEDSTSEEAKAIVAALGYAANEKSTGEGVLIDAECLCAECQSFRN